MLPRNHEDSHERLIINLLPLMDCLDFLIGLYTCPLQPTFGALSFLKLKDKLKHTIICLKV